VKGKKIICDEDTTQYKNKSRYFLKTFNAKERPDYFKYASMAAKQVPGA
jgi:hypothetical protein